MKADYTSNAPQSLIIVINFLNNPFDDNVYVGEATALRLYEITLFVSLLLCRHFQSSQLLTTESREYRALQNNLLKCESFPPIIGIRFKIYELALESVPHLIKLPFIHEPFFLHML